MLQWDPSVAAAVARAPCMQFPCEAGMGSSRCRHRWSPHARYEGGCKRSHVRAGKQSPCAPGKAELKWAVPVCKRMAWVGRRTHATRARKMKVAQKQRGVRHQRGRLGTSISLLKSYNSKSRRISISHASNRYTNIISYNTNKRLIMYLNILLQAYISFNLGNHTTT